MHDEIAQKKKKKKVWGRKNWRENSVFTNELRLVITNCWFSETAEIISNADFHAKLID